MKSALKYAESNPLIVGAVLLGAVAVAWIAARGAKGMGQDIGAGVVNAAAGVVSGAADAAVGVVAGVNDALGIPRTSDVVNWANSDSNPLQPLGSWLGRTAYDWTHPLPVATGAQNSASSLR